MMRKAMRTGGLFWGLAVAGTGIFAASTPAHGVTVGYWDFNGGSANPTLGAGALSWNSDVPALVVPSGGIANASPASAAGGALAVSNFFGLGNGKSLLFDISTLDLKDIRMSFAAVTSDQGFTQDQISFAYSSGVGGFSDISQLVSFSPPVGVYGLFNFDLSSLSDLNDQATARFRITLDGATSSAAYLLLDNVLFTGNAMTDAFAAPPMPEPLTTTLLGLGIGALGMATCRRRR